MRHRRLVTRIVICAAVIGEAICLVHYGWIEKDHAGAFCIVSAWIKDFIHKLTVRG